MNCEEKTRLAAEYAVGTNRFTAAITELRRRSGTFQSIARRDSLGRHPKPEIRCPWGGRSGSTAFNIGGTFAYPGEVSYEDLSTLCHGHLSDIPACHADP